MSNTNSLPTDRQAGFTLIELLVSLTILSVILVLVSGGLRVLTQNWDTNTQRIGALDMVSRAFDIFTRDCAGLQRVPVTSERSARYLFSGTATRVAFITLEPPYPTAEGPYYVEYTIEDKKGSAELIRARAPYQQGMRRFPGATPANQVLLLQGPFKYEFQYAQANGETVIWKDSWFYARRLPDMIRIRITNPKTGQRALLPFTAVVRADAEVSCLRQHNKLCSAETKGELKLSRAEDKL